MKTKIIILRRLNSGNPDPLPAGPMAGPKFGDSGGSGGELVVDIEVSPGRNVLHALSQDRTVLRIAPAISMRLIEPIESSQVPHLQEAGATWGVAAVGAPTSPFDGAGVTVAVLDSGIDSSHAAFAGMLLEERDFTGAGNGDQLGHGTHCAGTIFGREINGRRIGVAPGVSRALIGKVLGGPMGGASDVVSDAMLWAYRRGANIVSMSLGFDFPGYVERLIQENGLRIQQATSIALEAYGANVRLFERLTSFLQASSGEPVLHVAAAGNESGRDQRPPFEINVAPPAASPGIVAVGALSPGSAGFTVAPFSNARATVVAPGVGILSARSGGGTRTLSGTSMATPHVAGVAALWAQKLKEQRSLTSALLQAHLIASSTLRGLATDADPVDVGSGIVQAPNE